MAAKREGVIVNVASDLAVIAPDQRLYRRKDRPSAEQAAKPVTYSVAKHALIGLTRYLATYWADVSTRQRSVARRCGRRPGSGFVERVSALIPLGRMARRDEYRRSLVFLASSASSYMTGANLVVDGEGASGERPQSGAVRTSLEASVEAHNALASHDRSPPRRRRRLRGSDPQQEQDLAVRQWWERRPSAACRSRARRPPHPDRESPAWPALALDDGLVGPDRAVQRLCLRRGDGSAGQSAGPSG